MVGSNVKDLLKRLVALQKIDAEVYEFRHQLKEQPSLLADLKAKYDRKRARYTELERRLQDLERSRKAQELDLKSKEDGIVKANTALMSLKTNKEYQAKLFEIENMKADTSRLEEDILKLMDESTKVTEELGREKAVVDEEEKAYLAGKGEIEARTASLQEKVATFEGQRHAAMEGIDKATLAVYERLLDNRHGQAMVPVVNDACGGCFMKQTAQVVNKLKMCDEIVRCEMCARILYLESEI